MPINITLPGRLTQPRILLDLTAISGEVPTYFLHQIVAGEKNRERILCELKERQLVRVFHKDKLRGLRLTVDAKKLLLEDNSDRYSFYLTGKSETNLLKSEITRRLRLHRIAEVYITMRNSGVTIFRDEKPDIFGTPAADCLPLSYPAFYNSREIKEAGAECVKIRGSRATGVLLAPDSAYIVYNAGSSLMKWDYNAETRVKALMQTALCRDRGLYQSSAIKAIMFGDSMRLAGEMLTCASGMNGNYLALDREQTGFYYIPSDHTGQTMIKLLCRPDIKAELYKRLSGGLYPCAPHLRVENDAMDECGNPVLFAYDFDMPRIVRFNNALEMYGATGTIICFDYQVDTLRSYCHECVQIRTMDYESFNRRFFT